MDDEKKKEKPVYVNGKMYNPNPSMWDRVKESVEPTQDRAQLEAIRKRRQIGS